MNEIEQLQTEIESLKTELLYKQAEIQNILKRTMREKNDLLINGGKNVLKDFLPILDDLKLAEKSCQESSDLESLKTGVKLIFDKLNNFLYEHGVERIPVDGNLDTDLHEAVAVISGENGKIMDVVQDGYFLNGQVLRHSKVVVGKEDI